MLDDTLNRPCRCSNCDYAGLEKDLNTICDLTDRLEPGEETPAGQCPECQGLCYLVPENEVVVRKMVADLETAGVECEELDDAVHDAASDPASDANNDGLEGQVKFLVQQLGAEGANKIITDTIKEHGQ